MVNQQLIDWIKSEEAQGYTPQQLYNSLIQQGYTSNEANEAIIIASQPSQQGGDIFSVFADTPPSTSPGNYGSYDNYETSSTYSTSKSADELLNEIDSSDMMGAFDEYESEEKDDDEKDFFQLESY